VGRSKLWQDSQHEQRRVKNEEKNELPEHSGLHERIGTGNPPSISRENYWTAIAETKSSIALLYSSDF
jgi:hypothetical protein